MLGKKISTSSSKLQTTKKGRNRQRDAVSGRSVEAFRLHFHLPSVWSLELEISVSFFPNGRDGRRTGKAEVRRRGPDPDHRAGRDERPGADDGVHEPRGD